MREVKRAWNGEKTSLNVYINEGVHQWSLHVVKAANGERESFAYYSNHDDEWNIESFKRVEILSDEAAEKLADEFIQEFGRG